MPGWIKLHRDIQDHWINEPKRPRTKREAWEDMLMKVNFEEGKFLVRGVIYECKIGQSLQSLETWAKQFNWTIQQVRTFFKLLENDKMITTEGLQYTTRLTICNYEKYQQSVTDEQQTNQQTNNKPLTSQQQAANRPLTTIKEERRRIKNDKEEKECKEYPEIFSNFFNKDHFNFWYDNNINTEYKEFLCRSAEIKLTELEILLPKWKDVVINTKLYELNGLDAKNYCLNWIKKNKITPAKKESIPYQF